MAVTGRSLVSESECVQKTEMFTLSAEAAAESITKIWAIVREWKVYFEGYQVPFDQIEKIAPAFRHIDDLSTPSLRKLLP
jgi:serine/threonine-protein kinase HipA